MHSTGYAPISERRFVLFDTPLSEHAAEVFQADHPVTYFLTSTVAGEFTLIGVAAALTLATILSLTRIEVSRDFLWPFGFISVLVIISTATTVGGRVFDPTNDIYNQAVDSTLETVQRDLAEWLDGEGLDVDAVCNSASMATGYGRDAGSYFNMEETIMCGGHASATALYPLELKNDPAYQVTVFIDDMGINGLIRRDSLAGTV